MQLVGPPGSERRLLAVAGQLEEIAPWPRHAGAVPGSLTERRKSPAAARWHDQDMTDLVSLAEIERARDLLADVIRTTPLEAFRPLSATISGPAWLKCENLQRAGSFKVRGAYVRIARLTDEERQRGVVAASAGNHAQGVALAARLCGTAATVYMPTGHRCRRSLLPGATGRR